MYLQTSRLQYNLQGVVSFQTAFSKNLIRFAPFVYCIINLYKSQPLIRSIPFNLLCYFYVYSKPMRRNT